MNTRQKAAARSRAKSRGYDRGHWYPSWVFVAREDLTRKNMELYDRQQEQTRARCMEINPEYNSIPWLERWEVWKQARQDLGLS